MATHIDSRLGLLSSYYVEVDRDILVWERVIDTHAGMLRFCMDVEARALPLAGIARAEREIALLRVDRAEIDRMWNESLLLFERGDMS
jgi:hypothetical protein